MMYFEAGGVYVGGNKPLFGYRDLIPESDISAEFSTLGFEPENVADGFTWDYWKPGQDSYIEFSFAEESDVDYVAIAAHNLSNEISGSVQIQHFLSPDWVTILTIPAAQITDDRPIIAALQSRSIGLLRVQLNGASAEARIGVIYAGELLQSQRGIYVGHSPITLNRDTQTVSDRTEGGQWVGRNIIRQSNSTSINLSHLRADWYRANMDPMVAEIITKPFFFAWRPEEYPDETAYVWTTKEPTPQNSGPVDLMSVTLSVTGFIE